MMNWQSVIVCAGILAFNLADAAEVRHPQEEALEHSGKPYTEQDVAFVNEAAHINLAGTFSVPNGKAPFPAVLLVAASGPEGRDEEVQPVSISMSWWPPQRPMSSSRNNSRFSLSGKS